ncbi:MAG: hypothetical protein IJO28_04395 [Oscillospiraceae bacterium]|nr:hypothetical protein [Oscillospiraceae bacterium]
MDTQLIEKDVMQSEEVTKQLLLDLSVKEALLKEYSKKAEEAAVAAETALSTANQTKAEADAAKDEVNKELKIGFWSKKEAIGTLGERLKVVTAAFTKSSGLQIALAKAQTELARAQKVSLECQKNLAEISVAMVKLGCTSIAHSNFVIRQLEAILEDASQEELNEIARAELQKVIIQLREQETVFSRQDKIEQRIRDNVEALRKHNQRFVDVEGKIVEQDESMQAVDKCIESIVDTINKLTDETSQHVAMLAKQDSQIAVLESQLIQREKEIEELQQKINATEIELKKKVDNVVVWIAGGAATVALILSILQLFI